jgi:hypothetical protein
MNIRPIVIGVAVLAAGGYALYDYYGPDSKLARELKEIDQLEPDLKQPDCFPKGQNGKLFAIAVQRDRRPKAELVDEVTRRSAIKHDCVRGNDPKTVQRVVKALGADGVPVYAQVLEKCPVVKDEYPVLGCFALDALHAEGSKASVAAMEGAIANKDKARKNIYLGALFRLMNTQGWKTNAQLAQMLPQETDWEAKELVLEYVRHHRDPAARPGEGLRGRAGSSGKGTDPGGAAGDRQSRQVRGHRRGARRERQLPLHLRGHQPLVQPSQAEDGMRSGHRSAGRSADEYAARQRRQLGPSAGSIEEVTGDARGRSRVLPACASP